jgi:hypothetical protein
MKRFYCTVCKRKVRVYRLPEGVTLIEGPKGPVYSNGVCRHHDSPLPRAAVQGRARSAPPAPVRNAPAPAVAAASAPKKSARGASRT